MWECVGQSREYFGLGPQLCVSVIRQILRGAQEALMKTLSPTSHDAPLTSGFLATSSPHRGQSQWPSGTGVDYFNDLCKYNISSATIPHCHIPLPTSADIACLLITEVGNYVNG